MTLGLLAVATAGLLQGPPPVEPLALVDVQVLDLDVGTLTPGQAVLVEGGRIAWVGDAADFQAPPNTRTVRGEGRVLLPGLVDAHAHTDSLSFSLFLANGVTGVREMNGAARHLRWRDAIAAGAMPGPRLLVTSELLTGIPFEGVRYRLIDGVDDARTAADEAIGAGYDYLKIYDALSAAEYGVMVERARRTNLPITGHIPEAVGLDGVLAAEQGLEHAEKIVNDVIGFDGADLGPLVAAARRIADARVPVTPTLAVQEVLTETDPVAMERRRNADELAFMTAGTLGWWGSLSVPGRGRGGDTESRPARYRRAQRTLVARLAEFGTPILAGTDTPNPYMVPGFSLHEELDALVRAGLEPLDALRSATSTPGEVLPFDVPTGRVAVGHAADLMLVEGDPREDLRALRAPWGVVAAGRWLDRAALDAMLAAVREARTTR